LAIEAGPGERNEIVYYRTGPGWSVYSDGAATTVGDGCTQSSPGSSIDCTDATKVVVHAGDLDDSVTSHALGDDTVHGDEGDDTVVDAAIAGGGPGNDLIESDEAYSLLSGGGGDDRVTMLSWGGWSDGGEGNDTLAGIEPNDMQGGPGDDVLGPASIPSCPACPPGPIRASGGPGADRLTGAAGFDTLDGGEGDDILRGEGDGYYGYAVRDTLTGGGGNDLLVLGGTKHEDFYGPADEPPRGDVDPASRGQRPPGRVDGGAGDDRLEGSPNVDWLTGGEGNDLVEGGDGSDRVDGGTGSDTIDGGPGAWDQVDFTDRRGPLTIDLTAPGGDGQPGENDTYLPGIEFFRLGEEDDRFVGTDGPELVYGGLGADRIEGRGGADRLFGDTLEGRFGDQPGGDYGNDTLHGGADADKLDGDAGSDTIRGGAGDDEIEGGRYAVRKDDEVARYSFADVIDGGAGNDRIQDGSRITGGPGDDQIDAISFRALNLSPLIPLARGDTMNCGPGQDTARGDYYDEIALSCEGFREGTASWRTVRPGRNGLVTLKARCAWHHERPCRGRLRLLWRHVPSLRLGGFQPTDWAASVVPTGCRERRGQRSLGSGRFKLRAGRVNYVAVRLTPTARRSLARAGCLLARVELTFREPRRGIRQMTRTLALRPRR
jgi:Ca2+-binding RTX toxin-like protein